MGSQQPDRGPRDDVRTKGSQIKAMTGLFNDYIRAIEGGRTWRSRKRRARMLEIDEWLQAPDIEPTERARLLARRNEIAKLLQRDLPSAEMRSRFIEALPEFAAEKGYNREVLLCAGVPPLDLADAGIVD